MISKTKKLFAGVGIAVVVLFGAISLIQSNYQTSEDSPPTIDLQISGSSKFSGSIANNCIPSGHSFTAVQEAAFTAPAGGVEGVLQAGIHIYHSDENITVQDVIDSIKPDDENRILIAAYNPVDNLNKKFAIYPTINSDLVLPVDDPSVHEIPSNNGFLIASCKEVKMWNLKTEAQPGVGAPSNFEAAANNWILFSASDVDLSSENVEVTAAYPQKGEGPDFAERVDLEDVTIGNPYYFVWLKVMPIGASEPCPDGSTRNTSGECVAAESVLLDALTTGEAAVTAANTAVETAAAAYEAARIAYEAEVNDETTAAYEATYEAYNVAITTAEATVVATDAAVAAAETPSDEVETAQTAYDESKAAYLTAKAAHEAAVEAHEAAIEPEACENEGEVRNEEGECVAVEPEACEEGEVRNEADECVAETTEEERSLISALEEGAASILAANTAVETAAAAYEAARVAYVAEVNDETTAAYEATYEAYSVAMAAVETAINETNTAIVAAVEAISEDITDLRASSEAVDVAANAYSEAVEAYNVLEAAHAVAVEAHEAEVEPEACEEGEVRNEADECVEVEPETCEEGECVAESTEEERALISALEEGAASILAANTAVETAAAAYEAARVAYVAEVNDETIAAYETAYTDYNTAITAATTVVEEVASEIGPFTVTEDAPDEVQIAATTYAEAIEAYNSLKETHTAAIEAYNENNSSKRGIELQAQEERDSANLDLEDALYEEGAAASEKARLFAEYQAKEATVYETYEAVTAASSVYNSANARLEAAEAAAATNYSGEGVAEELGEAGDAFRAAEAAKEAALAEHETAKNERDIAQEYYEAASATYDTALARLEAARAAAQE